ATINTAETDRSDPAQRRAHPHRPAHRTDRGFGGHHPPRPSGPGSARVAAAALISDYDSLIIDNGTTCHAVAQELAGRPVTALCLSLHAAAALAAVPG